MLATETFEHSSEESSKFPYYKVRWRIQEVVSGVLGKATRVLVTHQVQFLPEADIVVKMEKGRIVATGTYSQLVAQGVEFAEFKLAQEGAALLHSKHFLLFSPLLFPSFDACKHCLGKPRSSCISVMHVVTLSHQRTCALYFASPCKGEISSLSSSWSPTDVKSKGRKGFFFV
jgi:hypothetical protein